MTLLTLYERLFDVYGPRHWWPAETPFEMAVGAILTQNTAWTNVEKAMAQLREADVLSVARMAQLSQAELQAFIRSSGFFRQKADRLLLFMAHLQQQHQGRLENLLAQPTAVAREELLSLKGIGPETADSILLYGGSHLTFVVDAYTRRLGARLGLLTGQESYEQIQAIFMAVLPAEVSLYNEYHALIVVHCKEFCRAKPLCASCFLCPSCPAATDFTGTTR